jgi:hypothetical protein
LACEGSQDGGERFFVKNQSDGAPTLSDPKPDPYQGDNTHKREEKFGTIHRLKTDITAQMAGGKR